MSSISTQFLLALATKGTILLLLTAMAATLARRARASVRHALWAAGLAGLLLVPVLSLGLPRWEVISLPAPRAPSPVREAPATRAPERGLERAVSTHDAPATPTESAKYPQPSGRTPAAFDAARTALVTWAAGVALVLAWLLFGHLRVRAIVRAGNSSLSPEWRRSVEDALEREPLGFEVGFREIGATMPMATGILSPVVLLPAAGAGWTAAHRRDVVVHELAHVRRRDCLTHLASLIACSMHWFNPLAWLAARQARVEREHACDDAVLAAGAVPSSYAQALLDTARSSPAAWATASAGLTMARPSHLADRLLAVLDARRRRGRLGRMALGTASVGTLALLAPVAAMAPARPHPAVSVPRVDSPPAGVQAPVSALPHLHTSVTASPPAGPATEQFQGVEGACLYAPGGSHRTVRLTNSIAITGMGSADDGKGNAFVAWTGADCSVVIHVVGEPSFTGDETDLAAFKGSGRFTVTDVEGRTERVYQVRGDGASLTRSYTVDREETAIDGNSRRWIAEMILAYIRQSGYQAELRAQRILAARGVDGLLQEIAAIRSDYGRGRYYLAGIANRPDPSAIVQFLDHAVTHLDSDYEKGRVLSAVPVTLLGEPRIRTSFLGVARSIDSDYEKARALVTASGAGLDAASTQTALSAALTVGSAYERSRVLQAVTRSAPAGRDLDPLYFDAATGIDSDYEKGRVLTIYAQHGNLSDASLGRLYAAAATITSSNDLANLLVASISSSESVGARCAGYLVAASRIDSDYDKARALLALQGAAVLTPMCANAAAEAAGSIESGNDRARVLIDFAGHGLLNDATRVEFFRAARGTDSSNDLRRILTAVLAQGRLSPGALIDLLDTAGGIDGDNDLASVLVAAAGTGQIVESVRPAYLRASGHLSSDYERKRALGAIGVR